MQIWRRIDTSTVESSLESLKGAAFSVRYKLDTHVHTSEVSTCAMVDGASVVRAYKDAGYAGIVITDHYTTWMWSGIKDKPWDLQVDEYLRGYRTAQREGSQLGLDVFLGMELRFDGPGAEDYLVFGVTESFILTHPNLNEMNLKDFKNLADESGLVIVQAHPFRPGQNAAPPDCLHGVEVYNSCKRHNSNNPIAQSYALENNLIGTSGTDYHRLEDIGGGGVYLPDKPLDSQNLARMLVEGNIIELIRE